MVLEHMEHIIRVVGEDHVAVGSDYDGAISPPAELGSGDRYPVLVQRMMDAGWSTARVEKVLGQGTVPGSNWGQRLCELVLHMWDVVFDVLDGAFTAAQRRDSAELDGWFLRGR